MHTVTNPDRILYVDDEEALLDICRIFLERADGIVVDVTTSPIEALRMILAGRYAAVVSDYQMPEMDGIALLKRVREAGSRVPFIIFTGKGREEVAIEALNTGADFYLQKGGDPRAQFAELSNAIRQLAGRRKAEIALRKSEEMLHKAENLAHLGSWALDCETGNLTWSDETYRIFGLEPGGAAMTYEAFLSMIHPEDRALVDSVYSTSIVEGKDFYTVEHRIIRADTGEIRYVVERCEHVRDDSGRVFHSIGMVHDITERKLAEQDLLQKHEELQAAYEQLTSIEEELRTSFDDLAESQRQLKESEDLYRRISGSISDVVYVCDYTDTGEPLISLITGAVGEITGYTDGEVFAMGCWKHLFHPDDLPEFRRNILSLSPGMSSITELRIIHRDGLIRQIRVTANCAVNQSGGMRLYGGWQDVTEQRRAEEALRESEQHFRTLANSGRALIWVRGLDAEYDYFNEPWLAFTGRTLEEEAGDGWIRGVHPDDRAECVKAVSGAFARQEPFSMIYRLRRHDGEYRWILDDGTPRYDTRGNFIGYIGHCLDITEMREMEKALKDTAEMMASIFRVAPVGIGMAVDEVITEVNRQLCEITGYTRDELIGQPMHLLCPRENEYTSALDLIHTRIERAGKCMVETRLLRKDGTSSDIQIAITPIDPDDHSQGMAFTVLDITENKAMEQEIEYHSRELLRQTNSLAVANKKLNLMNSITRHDILNQLTILFGNLWIVQEAEPGEDIGKYLARVKNAADRIQRQIEFTRDYTDLGVRSPEWQRISGAIRSAAMHELPIDDESGDLAVYADPMLTRVFANLMDNTLRHGESATRIRVRYRLMEGGDLALIWEDDGAGVPAEEKNRIFNRGVGKNTGLGLFLIREILAITGIGIAETGEPGKGARFEMRVPPGAYRVPE